MKRRALFSFAAAFLLLINFIIPVGAQSGRPPLPSREQQRREIERAPQESQQTPEPAGEDGTIKIDTTLVTIPVTVSDRNGKYIPNLTKRDFQLYEDGIEQEVSEFSAIEVPFHVVLMIDTSRSTVFRLEDIQSAAVSFVEQLRRDDKVMVVSFDDKIYVDSEFTSDRTRLRRAIYGTRTGGGTKLYDAVDLAITERLQEVEGRKAIVLFTDGVDTTSKFSSANKTIGLVEESEILVYPIRYDTEEQGRPNIYGGRGGNGPLTWPFPMPGGRQRRWPFTFNAMPQWGRGGTIGGGSGDYRKGAQYLQDLADRSGARLQLADSLQNLDRAFALIAEELRQQYAISYYPSNAARDGSYRRIRVRATSPNLVVRTREGYRASDDRPTSARSDERSERPRLARPN
jgi:Ca-activated chloride channel family protein